MELEPQLPVLMGTTISLKCPEDLFQTGDTSVTCIENSDFYFDIAPVCEREIFFFLLSQHSNHVLS